MPIPPSGRDVTCDNMTILASIELSSKELMLELLKSTQYPLNWMELNEHSEV